MKIMTKINRIAVYERREAELFPPFYYGFSYYDDGVDCITFHIFPLNIFVRLWRALRRLRCEKWMYLGMKGRILSKEDKESIYK